MYYGWVIDEDWKGYLSSQWEVLPVYLNERDEEVSVYCVTDSPEGNGGINPRYKMRCIGPLKGLVHAGKLHSHYEE